MVAIFVESKMPSRNEALALLLLTGGVCITIFEGNAMGNLTGLALAIAGRQLLHIIYNLLFSCSPASWHHHDSVIGCHLDELQRQLELKNWKGIRPHMAKQLPQWSLEGLPCLAQVCYVLLA